MGRIYCVKNSCKISHGSTSLSPTGPSALQAMIGAHEAGELFGVVITDMQMPDMDGRMPAASSNRPWTATGTGPG
jgi:CheY-like chemotaxis protein